MTAHSALYHTVKVAGGGPSVHACAVFFRAKSRHGDKFNQTPYAGHAHGSAAGAAAARLSVRPYSILYSVWEGVSGRGQNGAT